MLSLYHTPDVIEAGCDEAGRGCLAGPVCAAAVILPHDYTNDMLNDSKQLTERLRYQLREEIERDAVAWAVAWCSPQEIDKWNILRCSIIAMQRALDQLEVRPEHIIIDGNRWYPYHPNGDNNVTIPAHTIIKGDATFMSIAAASILAKTYRDDLMKELDLQFPQYRWGKNKGYPTVDHRNAIAQYGVTDHHRKTFHLLEEQTFLF
ncbi:MAG: ribonuclease HII [Bacteroidaceae bacterium]|nr:ribonuclease HII [Bacteroidaceae bacterium]